MASYRPRKHGYLGYKAPQRPVDPMAFNALPSLSPRQLEPLPLHPAVPLPQRSVAPSTPPPTPLTPAPPQSRDPAFGNGDPGVKPVDPRRGQPPAGRSSHDPYLDQSSWAKDIPRVNDLFDSLRVFVEVKTPHRQDSQICRAIAAHGGDCVPTPFNPKVTHIILLDGRSRLEIPLEFGYRPPPPSARLSLAEWKEEDLVTVFGNGIGPRLWPLGPQRIVLRPQWVWDCIKEDKILPVHQYRVRWSTVNQRPQRSPRPRNPRPRDLEPLTSRQVYTDRHHRDKPSQNRIPYLPLPYASTPGRSDRVRLAPQTPVSPLPPGPIGPCPTVRHDSQAPQPLPTSIKRSWIPAPLALPRYNPSADPRVNGTLNAEKSKPAPPPVQPTLRARLSAQILKDEARTRSVSFETSDLGQSSQRGKRERSESTSIATPSPEPKQEAYRSAMTDQTRIRSASPIVEFGQSCMNKRSVSPFPLDLSNPMPPPMPTKVPESMPSLQPMQADPASNIACIEYISKEAVLDNAALGKAAVVADVISGITPDEDITSKEFTVEAIMREERTTEDTSEGQRTHEEGKSEVTTQALTKDATVEETAVPPVAAVAVANNPVVPTPKVHKQNNEVFVPEPYVPDPEEAKGCGFFALPNAPTDFSVICVKQNQVKRYRLLIEQIGKGFVVPLEDAQIVILSFSPGRLSQTQFEQIAYDEEDETLLRGIENDPNKRFVSFKWLLRCCELSRSLPVNNDWVVRLPMRKSSARRLRSGE